MARVSQPEGGMARVSQPEGGKQHEGGDQAAIGPGNPRSWHTPLEHGELVAQDEPLDVLGGVGSGAQHDPAQELGEHLVDQPQRHQRIMPGHLLWTNGQVTSCARSFGHPQAEEDTGELVPVIEAAAVVELTELEERARSFARDSRAAST